MIGQMISAFGADDVAGNRPKFRKLRFQMIADTRLRTLGEQARLLRGDVDAIALKALEKDRARRYATPSELAADIGRYLRNEPVTAHPASARYRAWKYVRRHRLGVAFAAAVAFLLVAGIVATSWMAIRASRAEQQAEAVNDFLQYDVLAHTTRDGRPQPDPDMKVRTALDRAAARIEGKFGKQPLVEASVRETIGHSYADLGLYPQAQREFQRALDLRRPILGAEHRTTLWTLRSLAFVYQYEGRLKDAERLNGEALRAQRRVLGAEHPDTLGSEGEQAAIYSQEGRYAEAEAVGRELLTVERRRLGEDHPYTLLTSISFQ